MLKELFISKEASYSEEGQSLSGCKKVNYIFGANGAGKTTISRVIAAPESYSDCALVWEKTGEIQRLVFNRDFAERNFVSRMPGIFTLGDKSQEVLDEIATYKSEKDKLAAEIASRHVLLFGEDGTGGKTGELARLDADFDEVCWEIKRLWDSKFAAVLAGYRGSKAKFREKLVEEAVSNTSELLDAEDLATKVSTLYGAEIKKFASIDVPDFSELLSLEDSVILSKKVIGKEDVDIAALITQIDNSDWVREGRRFWKQTKPTCPFCQTRVTSDLERNLKDYFDDAYEKDIAEIERVATLYKSHVSTLTDRLERIISLENSYVDNSMLRSEVDRFIAVAHANLEMLERKRKEPSSVVALGSVADATSAIQKFLSNANVEISSHNRLIDNMESEKERLERQVWKFILGEGKPSLTTYLARREGLEKAIKGISEGIDEKKTKVGEVNEAIAKLERSITSVQPTVDEINRILQAFGFSNFSLRTTGERDHLYEIVRADGSDATHTLSEGEKSFITFLYFYSSIRGSHTQSGITDDRVVVFDDPVSSLDSDVLFIVSALIREVVDEAKKGTGSVKQVFILTHNIYFHKEVSYDGSRGKGCLGHEAFWIVRKEEGESRIVPYNHNPIKTSYELLWAEVRDAKLAKVTIQNTLRRIIENYFKILGNTDKDKILAKFEGRDKLICASLFSWVNDGSHSVHDDLYLSADQNTVDVYLRVFKEIFEKTEHLAHYRMMMGADSDEIVEPAQGA